MKLFKPLIDLLYPRFCVECGIASDTLLCPPCSICFDWLEIDPEERRASCFWKNGALFALLEKAGQEKSHALHSAMASMLVFQLLRSKWPFPEMVTAIPAESAGFCLDCRLAYLVASKLKVPFKEVIHRGEEEDSYLLHRFPSTANIFMMMAEQNSKASIEVSRLFEEGLGIPAYTLAFTQKLQPRCGLRALHPRR